MSLPSAKQPAALPIEIPADLLPVYANLARIAHAPTEFVFDFARFLPGDTKASVTSRVIMSPVGAKLLLQALTENVSRYETNFGQIIIPGGSSLADSLFRPFHPPENPPDKGKK